MGQTLHKQRTHRCAVLLSCIVFCLLVCFSVSAVSALAYAGEIDAEQAEAQAEETKTGVVASVQANAGIAGDTTTITYVNMYRLYNPNSGEHFYTSSLDEAASVVEAGWRYEGVGWVAPSTSSTPVYRLYNPNAGDHHYTTSEVERDSLIAVGWNSEGIGWYSADTSGIPVLRQYNPNAVAGAHNFTTSSDENSNLVDVGWSPEGIGWYAANQSTQAISGRWIVTAAWGSLERYWLDSTATIAKDRLVNPTSVRDSGAGWYAYAKADGAVVRGTTEYSNWLFIADNEGTLTSNTGWCVTGDYAEGALQRYYIDPATHGMAIGFFQAEMDGATLWFYGLPDKGYVSRGKYQTSNGVLVSDNEGKLLENDCSTAGMYVSDLWDDDLQRYYLVNVDGHIYAKTGFFTVDGYGDCYGWEDKGYLARNCELTIGTGLYSADNDGKLTYLREIVTRTRDTYLANPTWTGDVSYIAELREKADASADTSKTYCAVVDDTLCRVVIFKRSGNSWVAEKMYNCNGGRAHYTGTFSVAHKRICNWDDSYFGKGYNDWATCYIEAYTPTNSTGHYRYAEGKGYECCAGFHSTGYTTTGWNNSGCIGLQYDDAKWIYDNIDIGATVIIF